MLAGPFCIIRLDIVDAGQTVGSEDETPSLSILQDFGRVSNQPSTDYALPQSGCQPDCQLQVFQHPTDVLKVYLTTDTRFMKSAESNLIDAL